jgi:hypothetical protein
MSPTQFARKLRKATTEELLGEVFSVRSVPRLYSEEQVRLRDSLETAVRRVGGWCEMAASLRVGEWSGVSWLVSCETGNS